MSLAADLCRRHERMRTKRTTEIEQTWSDCFRYSFPLRANGLAKQIKGAVDGMADQAALFDSTAADSTHVLAANIMAGLTPSSALWFGLDVNKATDEEKRWLDDSARLLWENIHAANFDAEAFEACVDMVAAGQFALFADEDRDRGGFVFHQWPLGEVFCASTRTDGRIDVVHREYKLTAEAAVAEFGKDAVSEKVRKAAEADPDQEFTFIHALFPRDRHVVNAKLAKNLPVASVHCELDGKQVVRESGFHEMPVIVPRWMRVPGSIYAVGPMYAALPDVRQLNYLKYCEQAGADLAINGMWLGVDDGVFNPRTVRIGPRKVIVAASKDSFSPLSSGADFQLSEVMVSKLQAAIRKTLMADQLQPQDGPQMTAEEVRVRVDMVRRLLGPIYGRLQAEYLKPFVERCFGIAYRAGVFAPPPQSLLGRAFSISYENPMARAQKLDDVAAIEQTIADVGQMAGIFPAITDEIDPVKALDLIMEGRGVPQAVRRAPEDVAKLRDARDQAQQQQQAAAMQQQVAGTAMTEAAKKAATA